MRCNAVLGLATAGLMIPSASGALTLDFLSFTDNNAETAVEGFFPPDDLIGGPGDPDVPLATRLRGYQVAGGGSFDPLSPPTLGALDASPFAYLDSNSAGAGVCKVLSGSQCDPSSDDNVTAGEVLAVSFDVAVKVNALSFRGEGHPNDPDFDPGEVFALSFDDGASWKTDEDLINAKNGVYSAFDNTDPGFNDLPVGTRMLLAFRNEQFYLSAMDVTIQQEVNTEVPLPAGLVLLLSGLGALAGLGARRAA